MANSNPSPKQQQRKRRNKKKPKGGGNARSGRNRRRRRRNPGAGPNGQGAAVITPTQEVGGVLELTPDGFGYLRRLENAYQAADGDVFVPAHVVRQYGFRTGSYLEGVAGRAPKKNRIQLCEVRSADGQDPALYARRVEFHRLTSVDPYERLRVEESGDLTMRVLDLIAPIGKGQRGLIVAPPRTGKTVILQKLAQAIARVHPEVHLMMVLIDERPEEVTEMRRTTTAEVVASSNDELAARHVKVAEIVLERARRLVEAGRDVVVLLDSLTRMARAYNIHNRGTGRTLSGGLDAGTMQKPREFFGAARKAEEGGSLTIVATALVDTGSRMDQIIFEEFKGTGNMEVMLHRPLADRRIFPAIDIHRSGTRKEEKLRPPEVQQRINLLRRILAERKVEGAMEALIAKVSETESNAAFLELMAVR